MKKLIYFPTLIFIILLMFSTISFATSDFAYELDSNNNAIITAYNGTNANIVIPSTLDGHNVISIKAHAFDESRNSTNGSVLVSVKINEGITSIGDFAFVGCTNLTTVTLPESLTSLGDQTFIGCTKLNKINIPSNLKQFKTYIFQETGFTEFIIPDGFENIGECTFRLCGELRIVKVYSDTVVFAPDVFQHCSSDLVLYGHENSTTQEYAIANGINFKVLSDSPTTPPAEPNPPTTQPKPPATSNPSASISLNKNYLSLLIGEEETLSATISPVDVTSKNINWSSSDENVAIVENGKVIARNVGTATITAELNSSISEVVTSNVTFVIDITRQYVC